MQDIADPAMQPGNLSGALTAVNRANRLGTRRLRSAAPSGRASTCSIAVPSTAVGDRLCAGPRHDTNPRTAPPFGCCGRGCARTPAFR